MVKAPEKIKSGRTVISGFLRISLVILSALAFLPIESQAKLIRKKFPYEWVPSGNVRTMYETPTGKVYRISGSESCDRDLWSTASTRSKAEMEAQNKRLSQTPDSEIGVNALNLILFGNDREKEDTKARYAVLEFSIRAFPVQKPKIKVEKSRNNGLRSLILQSSGNCESITSQSGINITYPGIYGVSRDLDFQFDRMIYNNTQTFRNSRQYINAPAPFHALDCNWFPMYTQTQCRIIIDRKNIDFFAVDYSGVKKIVLRDARLRFSKSPLATFALTTANDAILEVSSPTVRFMEENDLRNLIPLKQTPYPYSLYANDRKSKRRWGTNPDFNYAESMKQLYGKEQDWEKGLKEMRQLSYKDHALAQFQAGCAYYRGIGCEIDLNKAESYFKDAAKLEVPGAITMQKAIAYRRFIETGGKELFAAARKTIGKLNKENKERSTDAYYPHRIVPQIRISGNPKVEFYALLHGVPSRRYTDAETLQVLDSLCKKEFTPALYMRATYSGNTPQETLRLYEKGAALGDPFCTLEKIKLKMQAPGFQRGNITVNELWNAREIPFIHALLYGMRNPQSKYYRDICRQATGYFKNLSPSTPEEHFLFGLSVLQDFLYAQSTFGKFRFFSPDASRYYADSLSAPVTAPIREEILKALKSLETAAEQGIPEAQYFVSEPWVKKNIFTFNQFKSLEYLKSSSPQNVYSAVRTAQILLERREPDSAMTYIKRIPDQNAMIALELQAQYFQLKHPNSPIAVTAWNKAGAAGSLAAMRFLGNYEYKNKNFAKAAAYRRVYLDTDTRLRNMNLNEITWGDAFTRYEFPVLPSGLPFGTTFSGMGIPEAKRLLELVP